MTNLIILLGAFTLFLFGVWVGALFEQLGVFYDDDYYEEEDYE